MIVLILAVILLAWMIKDASLIIGGDMIGPI